MPDRVRLAAGVRQAVLAGTHGACVSRRAVGPVQDRVAPEGRTAVRGRSPPARARFRIEGGIEGADPPAVVRFVPDRRHDQHVAGPRRGHVRQPDAFRGVPRLLGGLIVDEVPW